MLRNWLKKDQENSKERALMEANQFQKTLNPGQKEQAPKTVSKKRPLSEESATDETALSDPKSKSTKIAPVQNEVALVFQGPLELLEDETMGDSWRKVLDQEFRKPYFKKLKKFLEEEISKKKIIFPPMVDIYSWSRFCNFEDVKVVIIGQDPYHNHNQAHGLCFSVRKGIAIPPSLVNIYKELSKDITGFNIPGHGYLDKWAQQGVLLLNAVLTVEAHKANSHAGKGWESFTDAIIKTLARTRENIVFMLWGNYAAKKATGIDPKKHLLLKSVHPSPLSAHRGYFGCQHFSKANEYLESHGKETIDWNLVNES